MPRARRRRTPRRKLPEELLRAWVELYGKPGSDEEAAASALLVWAALKGTAQTEKARSFIDDLREQWRETSLRAFPPILISSPGLINF